MTIVVDTVESASGSSGTTLTWSHTVGPISDGLLIVALEDSTNSTTPWSGVTYGGVALTLLESAVGDGSSAQRELSVWYLKGVTPGTASVVATNKNTGDSVTGASISLGGVDQTTPLGTPEVSTSTGGGSTSLSAVTTGGTVTDVVLAVCAARSTTVPSAGSPQTSQWSEFLTTNTYNCGATQPGGSGSITSTFTMGVADAMAIVAIAVKAASSPTTNSGFLAIMSAFSSGQPSSGPTPNGPSGSWTQIFAEDFAGSSLNTTTWNPRDGWTNQNGVTSYAANVAVSGGQAALSLASSTSGAEIATQSFTLETGQYAEARMKLPGSGATLEGWFAFWASGPSWPAAGEADVMESSGNSATSNYHSPTANLTSGTIAGNWADGNWHTFGVLRGATENYIYWDGVLVDSYATSDNGQGETLILTIGNGNGNTTPGAFPVDLIVDYVYAWAPA